MRLLKSNLIIVLFLVLTASAVRADFNMGSYNGMRIAGVTLRFPPQVRTEGIKSLIKTKQGSVFNIMDADDSIRLIYATGQCSDVRLDTAAAGNAVTLTYVCTPVMTVSKLEFYGVRSVQHKALEQAVFLQPDTRFYAGLLEKIRDRVIKFYNDDGYMTVNVTPSFTQTSYDTVQVDVRVSEGSPAIIKTIRFTGETGMKASALLDNIGIETGQRAVRSSIEGVAEQLEEYYHHKGYWQADVHKPGIIYSDDFREAYITVNITAGPVYVFQFKGVRNLSNDDLLNIMGIKKSGGFLNFDLYRSRIENELRDRGYYFCKVRYSVIRNKEIRVVYTIEEGRKVYIAGIFFNGNRHISSSVLKSQMLTSPWRLYAYLYNYTYNGMLAPSRLENDIKSIIYLYKINGYQNVKVTNVSIAYAGERKEWVNVTIFIDEGPQTTNASVGIKGVSPDMNGRVIKIIGRIELGGPFNVWQVQDVKRAIEQLYFSNGYINASVDYDYTLYQNQADITFRIKEGKRIKIGRIIIAGNTKTADWVIMKNLEFKSGTYFIPENIIQSRINLLRTGYFENVNIKTITDKRYENTVNVAVIVKERKTRGVSVSVGYGTVEGYRGGIDVYDNNIMGTARSVNFHIGGGIQPAVYAWKPMFNHSNYLTNQRDIELGYTENYLFYTNVTGRINLVDSYVRNLWIGYGLKTESAVAGLDRNIGSFLKLSLQYSFEIRQPMDVQPGIILTPADFQIRQLGFVSPILFLDTRNNPFNPTNGYFQMLRVDWAKHWFFSQEEYVKVYTAATKYWPISSRLVYVLSLRGGYAWPLGATTDLPIEKRFFLGGGSTVRGFAEDTIGPGTASAPVGGDIMLNYQTEVRVRLIDSFDGVVFTDGGNVWSSPSGFDLKGMHDIRKSAGFGIRYVTPAGALNLDLGFKLDRRPGEQPTAIDFYIGTVL